jgi:hypothetical protein
MNDPILKKAHKRVKAKKGFFVHFGVYISVGMFFLLINIATFHEGREWWFFFPMIPWLVGLMIHYFTVFGLPGTGIMAEGWEEAEWKRKSAGSCGRSGWSPVVCPICLMRRKGWNSKTRR